MTMHAQYDDLDGLLSGPEPDYDTEPEPPRDADDADRMLRKLARLQRELNAAEELAGAERARVDDWLARERDRIEAKAGWFRRCLEGYHRALLAEDPRRKTVSLPNGRLVSRAQQPDWTFDPDQFIPWAETNAPELLRRKPADVDKVAAKKALARYGDMAMTRSGGEAVPGVIVLERPPKFVAEPEV